MGWSEISIPCEHFFLSSNVCLCSHFTLYICTVDKIIICSWVVLCAIAGHANRSQLASNKSAIQSFRNKFIFCCAMQKVKEKWILAANTIWVNVKCKTFSGALSCVCYQFLCFASTFRHRIDFLATGELFFLQFRTITIWVTGHRMTHTGYQTSHSIQHFLFNFRWSIVI